MNPTNLPTLITMVVFALLTFLSIISSSRALATDVATSFTGGVDGSPKGTDLETHIVFVKKPQGELSENPEELDRWYQTFLPLDEEGAEVRRMVQTYHSAVTGFAAKLAAEEVEAMEEKDGFLSAQPEKIFNLHTTHTPEFLGLNSGVWNLSNYGKGMIIALMDTGITPDHPSFSALGMPPPPAKWKGRCDFSSEFCTNKIIGAKNFINTSIGPLDDHGHGTHTSSIAAGRPVSNANFMGQYNGTATGIAPLAHPAIYKVCDDGGFCKESDILAGMDAAIDDGADILSLSLGLGSLPFYNDPVAVGAFSAIRKGIFVSCSAGNSGPNESSLSNDAPWLLTVGASTVDRNIRAVVKLGNNQEFNGESLTNFSTGSLPLVYPGVSGTPSAALCSIGSLDDINVHGKIVLCESASFVSSYSQGQVVKAAGGAGVIVIAPRGYGNYTESQENVLPASVVTYADGSTIKHYINSAYAPEAAILFRGTVYGVPYAPQVAEFSSRGPSIESPGILKPDVLGPGKNILAAWPATSAESSSSSGATFVVLSGTSMSCPHLAAVAALLKRTHPNWSPAAIKSAIMTTADILNLEDRPILDERFQTADLFATGAGHVNPSKAAYPGLVYDMQPEEYPPYLCGMGYSDRQVSMITSTPISCSKIPRISERELNYPSFSVALGTPKIFPRTVTNVGDPNSTYNVIVLSPQGVEIAVKPTRLYFSQHGQRARYSVSFRRAAGQTKSKFGQGYIIWESPKTAVRSPISVRFN